MTTTDDATTHPTATPATTTPSDAKHSTRRGKGRRKFSRGDHGGSLFLRGDRWYVRLRIGSGETQRTIVKSARGQDREGAAKMLAALVERYKHGGDAAVPSTFDDLRARILAQLKTDTAPGTLARERGRVERCIAAFRGRQIAGIEPAHVAAFLRGLTDDRAVGGSTRRAVSRRTKARFLTTLRAMFAYAVEWGFATADPTRDVTPDGARPAPGVRATKRGKREPVRVFGTFLDDSEVDAIIAASRTGRSRDDGLEVLLRVMADTGVRRSEALRLTWQDVQLSARPAPEVYIAPGKNGRDRRVPLTAKATEALVAWRERSRGSVPLRGASPVWPLLATPSMESSVSLRFNRAARRARVRLDATPGARLPKRSPIRLHDLRHTFISRLFMLGVPPQVAQQLAGHSTLAMTLLYARHAPGDLRYAAVAAIDAARADGGGVTNGGTGAAGAPSTPSAVRDAIRGKTAV